MAPSNDDAALVKTTTIRYCAFGAVTVSAVPPPATLWMPLAGLLVIGAVARWCRHTLA